MKDDYLLNPLGDDYSSAGPQRLQDTEGAKHADAPAPDDLTNLKEMVQQARSEAELARIQANQTSEDVKDLMFEFQGQRRRTTRHGALTALVALALLGVAAWSYFSLREHGAMLAQMPSVQSTLDAIGQRVGTAEQAVRDWASDLGGITARVSRVEDASRANLQAARAYASEQAAKVQQQVQTEINNRTSSLQAGIGQVQSAQQEDRTRMARLEGELTEARDGFNTQLAEVHQETGNLGHRVEFAQRGVDTINRNMQVQRMDFEISKDRTQEVVPGVTLTLSKMDVSYQRVEGRLHVIPDGRILWIRGQGIQQPVRFYSSKDARAYELVFTRVNQDGAIGYVLAPSHSEETPELGLAQPGAPPAAEHASASTKHVALAQ